MGHGWRQSGFYLYGASTLAAQFLQTLVDYPPSQTLSRLVA